MRTRLLTAAIVAVMALGSLALWTAIPAGWMYVTRDIEPGGVRFVLTIFGCIASMVGAGSLLYRLEVVHFRVSGTAGPDPVPPSWQRSAGHDRPRLGLLDTFMAASAVLALVALVLWWVVLADSPNPSGPLQPL